MGVNRDRADTTRLYKRYGADPACKPPLGSCPRAHRTDCSARVRRGIAERSQGAPIGGYARRISARRPLSVTLGSVVIRRLEPPWRASRLQCAHGGRRVTAPSRTDRLLCVPAGSGGAGHDAVVAAAGAGTPGTGPVAGQHLRGDPAVQFHQVALGAAAVEPGVAEVVPEPVRVNRHAGSLPRAGHGLVDAVRGQGSPAAGSQPQLRPGGLGVTGAGPQVPVEAAGGLEADPHDPLPARLAPDPDLPVQEPQVAAGRIAGVVADTR